MTNISEPFPDFPAYDFFRGWALPVVRLFSEAGPVGVDPEPKLGQDGPELYIETGGADFAVTYSHGTYHVRVFDGVDYERTNPPALEMNAQSPDDVLQIVRLGSLLSSGALRFRGRDLDRRDYAKWQARHGIA